MCLGIPGRIVEICDAAQLRAKVDVNGVVREVSVDLLGLDGPDGARVGDWVVVHVGFALARITEDQARETLDAMQELNDMYARELGGDTDTDLDDADRSDASCRTSLRY